MKLNRYIVGLFFFIWLILNIAIGLYIPLQRFAIGIAYLLIMFIINIGIAYDLSLLLCASFTRGGDPPKLESLDKFPKVALLSLCCDDAVPEVLSLLNNQSYENHTIFVLDDSSNEEIKTQVDSYGYNTIRRNHRRGAKAGNINHWLSLYGEQFEYFIVLDNDGILEKTFIQDMLKYAEHPDNAKVALFQSVTKAWNTKRLFPYLMSSFYSFEKLLQIRVFNQCDSMLSWGHNILCRTKPFLEIGGFEERYATEDFATCLTLIERGYKTKAVNVESYDMASETVQFHTVRMTRWARGNLETSISKSWDIPLATKLRMFMGVYKFFQIAVFLLGMIIVVWGYPVTWHQLQIAIFIISKWFDPMIVTFHLLLLSFYMLYGILIRPVWIFFLSGISLKKYWGYSILDMSVNFYAIFYLVIGQFKSLMGNKAKFIMKNKLWVKSSFWEILIGMKWTILLMGILTVGLIQNPVAQIFYVFLYIPFFLTPFIIYFIQNRLANGNDLNHIAFINSESNMGLFGRDIG